MPLAAPSSSTAAWWTACMPIWRSARSPLPTRSRRWGISQGLAQVGYGRASRPGSKQPQGRRAGAVSTVHGVVFDIFSLDSSLLPQGEKEECALRNDPRAEAADRIGI